MATGNPVLWDVFTSCPGPPRTSEPLDKRSKEFSVISIFDRPISSRTSFELTSCPPPARPPLLSPPPPPACVFRTAHLLLFPLNEQVPNLYPGIALLYYRLIPCGNRRPPLIPRETRKEEKSTTRGRLDGSSVSIHSLSTTINTVPAPTYIAVQLPSKTTRRDPSSEFLYTLQPCLTGRQGLLCMYRSIVHT